MGTVCVPVPVRGRLAGIKLREEPEDSGFGGLKGLQGWTGSSDSALDTEQWKERWNVLE